MTYDVSKKSIFAMSLPIFVEIFLQMLVGNIDQLMLSQYSQLAVAAVGNANQIIGLLIIILSMMGVATTILITQYLGARNFTSISSVFSVSLLINAVFAVWATIFLYFSASAIFAWLSVPPEVLPAAERFLRIVSLGIIFQALYFVFVACFRGYSLLKVTMVTSIAINIVNIGGNLVLINGFGPFPALGEVGAAISTVASRACGLVLIYLVFRKYLQIEISLAHLWPLPIPMLKKVLSISIPTSAEALSYQLSQVTIMKMVNIFGVAVITTKIYAGIIATFTYIYTVALSTALQIVVGYLVGADRYTEAQKKVWYTVRIALALGPGLMAILYFFSDQIFSFFTDDPEVLALGKAILFIEIFLEFGRSVNIITIKALQASGDIKFPVGVGIFSMWFLAVGLGYLLGVVYNMGLVGIWIAMAIDECVRAAIFLTRWCHGSWKRKKFETSPLES